MVEPCRAEQLREADSIQESTETVLRALELRLLEAETRASPEQLSALLADELVAFGSSGPIWNKTQIIAGLLGERAGGATVERSVDDMQVKLLAEGVALVTYRATRRSLDDATEIHSLRSSIWKQDDRCWRMIFHQGTRADPGG